MNSLSPSQFTCQHEISCTQGHKPDQELVQMKLIWENKLLFKHQLSLSHSSHRNLQTTKEKRHHGEIHRQSTSFFQWLGQTRMMEAGMLDLQNGSTLWGPTKKLLSSIPKFNEIWWGGRALIGYFTQILVKLVHRRKVREVNVSFCTAKAAEPSCLSTSAPKHCCLCASAVRTWEKGVIMVKEGKLRRTGFTVHRASNQVSSFGRCLYFRDFSHSSAHKRQRESLHWKDQDAYKISIRHICSISLILGYFHLHTPDRKAPLLPHICRLCSRSVCISLPLLWHLCSSRAWKWWLQLPPLGSTPNPSWVSTGGISTCCREDQEKESGWTLFEELWIL